MGDRHLNNVVLRPELTNHHDCSRTLMVLLPYLTSVSAATSRATVDKMTLAKLGRKLNCSYLDLNFKLRYNVRCRESQ